MLIREAARRWDVSSATVHKWIAQGRIPAACKQKTAEYNTLCWVIPDDCEKPVKVQKHKAAARDTRLLPMEEKAAFIRLHGHDMTFGALKAATGLSHMEIREIYDSFF